jgi:hypothetical protein
MAQAVTADRIEDLLGTPKKVSGQPNGAALHAGLRTTKCTTETALQFCMFATVADWRNKTKYR